MSRYTEYFGQNNVKSELAVGISSIATTIQVNTNQGNLRGTKFPVLGTLEHYDSTGKCTKREIVKVVSKSSDTFTVVRKFAPCPPSDDATSQSQVSNSFDPGDSFSIYIPYEIYNAVSEAINDLYNNGNDRLFLKKTSGLGFEITPGNVRFETGEAYFPGGTGTVVDNSMNYVMLDSSFNIIVNQEELFDVQNVSIAEVKAVNGEITEITSRKIDGIAGRMGGGGDPVYGDGSDGDLVISENTILNAGQQYQFHNLTICSGATVSFSGSGGAKIKVSNLFINDGTIEMTDLDVDNYTYRDITSFCVLANSGRGGTPEPGKGGEGGTSLLCGYKGGNGGCAIDTPAGCSSCVGAGGSTGGGNGGNGRGFGAGGGGGRGGTQTAGSSGSGYNGGNGGNGGGGNNCCATGMGGGGGGGGGGFYTGKGGNGGHGGGKAYLGTYCTSDPARGRVGGNGGNGGILGNGGNGGNASICSDGHSVYCYTTGGNGGDGGCGVCGGNGGRGGDSFMYHKSGTGGNGGMGFYGGNGGNGGGMGSATSNNDDRVGCGGKGGDGIVPGKGGNGGGTYNGSGGNPKCYGYRLGTGGAGGNGISRLHSLNIKACCFCNTGCILSVGSVGGQGGNGGCVQSGVSSCYSATLGGNGGNGGKGGKGGTIQVITNNLLERGCIVNTGGVGGPGGQGGTNACNGNNNGQAGSQGESGDSGELYFFIVEG